MILMYLDYCATTPIKEEVIDSMLPYFKMYANPSSDYSMSHLIKKDINNVRQRIAEYIGAKYENEIIFTNGGTMANNLAIKGWYYEYFGDIQTSTIEHKSILNTCDFITKQGGIVEYIIPNSDGFLNPNDISISGGLVSVQYANNEIGTIQDIKAFSDKAHRLNNYFHTDATQSFSTIKNSVVKEGIDMLSMSGHKIGAPKGIGFLYKKRSIHLEPLIHGGKQEYGLIAGTENVPYIIGLGKAIELLEKDVRNKHIQLNNIYYYFLDKLLSRKDICLNGDSSSNRIKNNINVKIEGIDSTSLANLLDLNDIQVSNGSACNSGTNNISYVLSAIGLKENNSIRISYNENLTFEEIDRFIICLYNCIDLLKRMSGYENK